MDVIIMLLYSNILSNHFDSVAVWFGSHPTFTGAKYLVHFVPVFLSNNVPVCQQLMVSKQFHLHVQ